MPAFSTAFSLAFEAGNYFELLDVSTGAPSVSGVALNQTHIITPSGVTTGAPVADPVIFVNHLVAGDITCGVPVVGILHWNQDHLFAILDLACGVPAIGEVALSQLPESYARARLTALWNSELDLSAYWPDEATFTAPDDSIAYLVAFNPGPADLTGSYAPIAFLEGRE